MHLQAWIGLNAADALLTGLSFPLGAVELNPFLAAVATSLSLERMLLIKLLFAVAMGGAVWHRGAHRLLRYLNFAMVTVVFYNALIITYAL
jgi:hypothetical protein